MDGPPPPQVMSLSSGHSTGGTASVGQPTGSETMSNPGLTHATLLTTTELSLQMQDLEIRLQRIRKDVDALKDDDSLTQFATNVVNQMDGINQQTLSMQDQIERLTSKQPSTPETKTNTSTLTWLLQQSHAHKEELEAWKRRVDDMERLYVSRQDQIKRQRLLGPEESEVPDDSLTELCKRMQDLEKAEKDHKSDMFLTKEKIDQINKHIQQVSVRCVPSEKVEERLTRSITNLSDQLTMKGRRAGELEERLTRSIATLTEQLQQLRAREDANVSIGRSISVAYEKLELMIRQARQDFEVQLATHRQNVTTQLLECSTGLHQHVQNIKTEATKKLADEKNGYDAKVRATVQTTSS